MFKIQSKMAMSCRQLLQRPSNQIYQIECPVQNGEKLYLDKKTPDVWFTFESTDFAGHTSVAPIPAHRVLLANHSDVFKEMFYGDDGESIESDSEVPMADVPQEAFTEFLQFFYLNQVELHAENISGVMYLGQKYKVKRCIETCAQFLRDNATDENILIAAELAIRYNNADLLEFCEQFIIMNTDAVLESSGFLDCEQPTLAYAIRANLLACSEVKLFESCMEWVKAKSKQNVLTREIVDEYLGDLFYEIRFGALTIQELCNLTMKYDAVLSDDFKTLTKLIVLPNFQPEKFNTRPRQIKWNGAVSIVECLNIQNNQETDIEHECHAEDTCHGNNLKRKNASIFSTNKRLRSINSARNEIHSDSLSSDDDMEFSSESANKMLLKIISPPSEKQSPSE